MAATATATVAATATATTTRRARLAYRAYQSTASAAMLPAHVLRDVATSAARRQDTQICIYQPVAHLITQRRNSRRCVVVVESLASLQHVAHYTNKPVTVQQQPPDKVQLVQHAKSFKRSLQAHRKILRPEEEPKFMV